MKNPHLQLKEAIEEIDKYAYDDDDDEFIRKIEAEIKKYKQVRESQIRILKLTSPHHRAKKKFQIGILDKQIEQAERKLRDYKREFAGNDEKIEKANPNQEKLDAAFAKADIAHERIFILTKHTKPRLLEELKKIASDTYTHEELSEFYARIVKREAEELDEILASVNNNAASS